MDTVRSFTDMISWAFVSLFCAFWFTPCARCVLSPTWSVRPLSLCLVSSSFTPCSQRVLSLTWSVGSLSLCLMSSSFTPCAQCCLWTLHTQFSLSPARSAGYWSLSPDFQCHSHTQSRSVLSPTWHWSFVLLPCDCHSVASCLWVPKHHHLPVSACFVLSN